MHKVGEVAACLQEAVDRGIFRQGMSPMAAPDVPVILATAQEIASGMALLHGHGIVHGDLTGGVTPFFLQRSGSLMRVAAQCLGEAEAAEMVQQLPVKLLKSSCVAIRAIVCLTCC